MILTVIAPEIVVVWAVRQWLVARRIAREHKRSKTHGFFALMGGFVRYDGVDGPYVIFPDDLKSHLRMGDITGEAIKDKSKGDALSKGFAILQAGWFILQIIARRIQGLAVTELETITLAFATLNFATYALWWNKPLDVRVPFVVCDELGGKEEYMDSVSEDIGRESITIWHTMRRTVIGAIISATNFISRSPAMAVRFIRLVPGMTAQFVRLIPGAVVNGFRYVAECAIGEPATKKDELLRIAFVIALFPIAIPVGFLFQMSGMYGDSDVEPKSKRVPTFYSGKMTESEKECALLAVALSATIFGAIHCIAWSFQFPTPTEQFLWRMSSLAIASVPVALLVVNGVGLWLTSIYSTPRWREWLEVLFGAQIALLCTLYVLARVALLIEAFVSLRLLPPDAYLTVNWTTFIPHI